MKLPLFAPNTANRMLKITPVHSASSDMTLIVEGKIVGAWTETLENCVLDALDSTQGSVLIDMAGVVFVDLDGAAMLHRLLERGLRVQALSPFVGELLRIETT